MFHGAAGSSSLRGLDLSPRGAAWASGSGAQYLLAAGPPYSLERRTLTASDGAPAVPGAAPEDDLRDIHVLDERTIVALAAGEGARSRVYHSVDGGARWQVALENPDPDGFFDAIAFWDARRGLLIGDPVRGRYVLYATEDGGASWRRLPEESSPPALPDEHLFAASGTCLVTHGARAAWFGTGGARARVLRSDDGGRTWTAAAAPLAQGSPSAGVFSLAFQDARRGVALGGDYQAPTRRAGVAAWTDDGGRTWSPVEEADGPGGYRSGVAFAPPHAAGAPALALAVGTSGADLSRDGGRTWRPLRDAPPLNAVAFAALHAAWVAGPDGRLGRVELLAGAGETR
ncbi:MAG: hypothetical protein H6713_35225 [Myxococcales bacterium]|nr:hypothetical protein [Myxococcales bacterium]